MTCAQWSQKQAMSHGIFTNNIAEEEYDRIKRETEPKRRSGSGKAGEDQRAG
jgi:hypothetical protein